MNRPKMKSVGQIKGQYCYFNYELSGLRPKAEHLLHHILLSRQTVCYWFVQCEPPEMFTYVRPQPVTSISSSTKQRQLDIILLVT